MKLIVILSSILLFSCGTAPVMQKPVIVWNGSSTMGGVCKFPTDAVKRLLEEDPQYAVFLKDPQSIVCINAKDKRFNGYGAMTFDDIGVMSKYILELKNSCRIWK